MSKNEDFLWGASRRGISKKWGLSSAHGKDIFRKQNITAPGLSPIFCGPATYDPTPKKRGQFRRWQFTPTHIFARNQALIASNAHAHIRGRNSPHFSPRFHNGKSNRLSLWRTAPWHRQRTRHLCFNFFKKFLISQRMSCARTFPNVFDYIFGMHNGFKGSTPLWNRHGFGPIFHVKQTGHVLLTSGVDDST